MEEWKKYKIGDLCSISSSKRIFAKEYQSSGVPFFRGKEIIEKQKGESISTELYISRSRYDEIKIKYGVPKEGDMLLTSVGTLGIPYIVKNENFYFKDGNLTWFSAFKGLNSKFLYYWFLSPIAKNAIEAKAIGSTQKALTIDTLSKFEINLPDIDTQNRIASILSFIDDKIELNRRINDNLEQQAQALFKSWFVDFEPFKEGKFVESEKKVSCIRGADIPEIRQGNRGNMPTRFILNKNFLNKALKAEDLVVEISGGSPTQSTGRICQISDTLLKKYDDVVICTNFCRAIKTKHPYSQFIYYLWGYLYKRGVMFLYENGTTGIKNLDINGLLEKEIIVIPDENTVHKYTGLCNLFSQIVQSNGYESERLVKLRDTLLPKLMSGELKISDINN